MGPVSQQVFGSIGTARDLARARPLRKSRLMINRRMSGAMLDDEQSIFHNSAASAALQADGRVHYAANTAINKSLHSRSGTPSGETQSHYLH